MKTFKQIQEELNKDQRFVFRSKKLGNPIASCQVSSSFEERASLYGTGHYQTKVANYVLLVFADFQTNEFIVKYVDSKNWFKDLRLPIDKKSYEQISRLIDKVHSFYREKDKNTVKQDLLSYRMIAQNYEAYLKRLNDADKHAEYTKLISSKRPEAEKIFNSKNSEIYYVVRYDPDSHYSSYRGSTPLNSRLKGLYSESEANKIASKKNKEVSKTPMNSVLFKVQKLTIDEIIQTLLK